MGNRAVVTDKEEKVGVYLHWNGGRDSIQAFLKYCELQEFRSFSADPHYAMARLTQVICNFFGSGLSCGVGLTKELDCDNYDNGVYIVDGWEIVGRKFYDGPEQDSYELIDMLESIDNAQPEGMKLGIENIKKVINGEKKSALGDLESELRR